MDSVCFLQDTVGNFCVLFPGNLVTLRGLEQGQSVSLPDRCLREEKKMKAKIPERMTGEYVDDFFAKKMRRGCHKSRVTMTEFNTKKHTEKNYPSTDLFSGATEHCGIDPNASRKLDDGEIKVENARSKPDLIVHVGCSPKLLCGKKPHILNH